jgi:hypothetical protein
LDIDLNALQAMYIGIGENSMIENSMMLWWL